MAVVENPYNSNFNATCIGSGTVRLGKNVDVRHGTIIEIPSGFTLSIGDETVIGYNSFFQCSGHIEIGRYSLLGPFNVFLASTHQPQRGKLLKQQPMLNSTLKISDNVWSGSHVTFNHGIVVYKSSIIGANSFVRTDVPESEVWGGVPAKYIKNNG
jgi:acetyltransferase-like isoleucine patch superfamily enzyme